MGGFEKVLADEHGKAAAVAARLDAIEGEIERRLAVATSPDWLRREKGLRDLAEAASERTAKGAAGAADADARLGRLDEALAEEYGRLRRALERYERPPTIHLYQPAYHDTTLLGSADRGRLGELADIGARLGDRARALARKERASAWSELQAAAHSVRTLDAARTRTIRQVSDAKREEVFGVGRTGVAELARDLEHLRVVGRWYVASRVHAAATLPARLADPFVVAEFARVSFLLLLIVGLAVYLRRSGLLALRSLRRYLLSKVHSRISARLIQGPAWWLDVLWPQVLFLATLGAVWYVAEPAVSAAEASLALHVGLWWGCYRLALAVAERLVPAHRLSREKHVARALQALRWTGRYLVGAAALLAVLDAFLGQGRTYHLMRDAAGIGYVVLLGACLRAARHDVAAAYISRRPDDRIAQGLASTGERPLGAILWTLLAAASLAGGSLAGSARQFALRFEQVRRAFAYLFRLKLERRAEVTPQSEPAPALPEDLRRCFKPTAVSDEPYAIERYPGLDRFEAALSRLRVGEVPGPMLVVGAAGFGKTSWLHSAARKTAAMSDGGVRFLSVPLEGRLLTRAEVVLTLADRFGAPAEARSDAAALCGWLRSQGPLVAAVDDLQCLFLRGVETYDALTQFFEIVRATGDRVFWVCTIARVPYEFLSWTGRGNLVFRDVLHLAAWSEWEIINLLEARIRASGYEVVYDDLLVERMDGVRREAVLVGTRREYMRLLWDYADGSPRVALHFWLQSLIPGGEGRVRVRLFKEPDVNVLESLDEKRRLLLAGVVWHQALTVAEASRSLRFSLNDCLDGLGHMADLGILDPRGERYRPTPEWSSAALRFLERKHLVHV